MSRKNIPKRWENESFFAYVRRLMNEIPKLKDKEAKAIALGTRRIRCSFYKPHYGGNAAERNLRHARNFTHGLGMSEGKPVFLG